MTEIETFFTEKQLSENNNKCKRKKKSVIAVLIGFEYTYGENTTMIPCIKTDLENIIKFVSSFVDKIAIFSDINVKDSFSDYITNVHNGYELMKELSDIEFYDRIIFYFSGHGVADCILTPDEKAIDVRLLLNLLIKDASSQVFAIMDCCHASSMRLCYKLNNCKLILRDRRLTVPIANEIILITGTNEDKNEKAISSKTGSVFTNNLCLLFSHKGFCRDFTTIIRNINKMVFEERNGYIQTTSIYTSKVMEQVVWSWIGNKYDLVYDDKLNCLRYVNYE